MSSTFKRLGQSELLPRYIFAESLVARRRVLEIGAVASTLGQSARFLSMRGARVVVAADNDLAAVQEAQARLAGPNLRFRPTVFDDFESGSFDLVIVADLAPYVRAPELMKEIARLVAKNGHLMGGLRNPAGLSLAMVIETEEVDVPPTYGQLLDVLSSHFKSVDVATQSPVLGYQLAFERGEGLQVDGSLAGLSEAAYYVVLAGHEEVRNFDPTWVQLPPEPLAFTGGKLEDAANRARDWRDRTERLKEVLEKKTAVLQVNEADLRETKQQLEAAKDAVSRLTAQLESIRERPEVVRDREDLANRIRQMEAELQVARERAIDAEGRVTAARGELEAISRQQKDAAIHALAAQESVRLERARREELATQLEDSRLRLGKAYEDLRKVQDDAASERVEHERTKIVIERLRSTTGTHERELQEAKDRELRLAEARTDALKAIEGLEAGFADVRRQLTEARELIERKEADRLSAVRSLDVEKLTRGTLEADLEREKSRATQLAGELALRSTEKAGAETEASALKAAVERLQGELAEVRAAEAKWKEAAGEHELKFSDSTVELQRLQAKIIELETQLEQREAVTQQVRLELDASRGRVTELEQLLRVSRENADRLSAVIEADQERLRETESRLTKERDALGAELSTTRAERDESREQLAGTESELVEAQKQLADRKEALAATENRVKQLEQSLSLAESRVKELTDDRDLLIIERDDLRGALGDLEKVRAEQGSRLGELSTRGDDLAHKLSETEGALAAARAELERTQSDSTQQEKALRGVLEERQKDLEDRQKDLEDRQKELEQERTFRTEAETSLETTKKTLDDVEHQLTRAREELTALQDERQRQVSALDGELTASKDREQAIELARRELETKYRTLEADAKLVTNRAGELEEKVRGLLTELREAEESAKRTQADLENQLDMARADSKAAAESATRSRNELDGQLTTSRNRITELETELAGLNDRVVGLSAQVERAEGGTLERERRLADLAQELDTSQEELRKVQAELTSRQDELVARNGELAARTGELAERTGELAASRERTTTLEGELGEIRSRATAAESARDERKAQVDRLEALLREREEGLGSSTARILKLEEEKTLLSQSLATAMSEAEHQKLELEESFSARAVERELLEKQQNLVAELEGKLQAVTTELNGIRGAEVKAAEAVEAARAELEATRLKAAASLDEKHAESEAKVKAVRDENQAALDAQAVAYQQSLDTHRAEAHKALSAREDELKKEIAAADAKATEAERQRVQLEATLAERTAAADAAAQAAREAHEALDAKLRESVGNHERAVSEAQTHLDNSKALQNELDTIRQELITLRASLAQVGGESKAATEARNQLEAELERLRQRIPPMETELTELRNTQPELLRLRERVPSLETQLAGTTNNLQLIVASERDLKRKVMDFEIAIEQARAKAAELEGAQLDSRTTRGELEDQLKDFSDRTSMAEAEAARLREARLLEQEQMAELRKQNAVLEAQVAEAARGGAPVSDEENAKYRRRVPELEAELEIARVNSRNEIETAQNAQRNAEELLLALRVKYGDLQHQLAQANEDVNEAKAETELLEQERERLATQLEALEKAIKARPSAPPPRAPTASSPSKIAALPPAPPPIPVATKPTVPPLTEQSPEVYELDVEAEDDSDAEEIVLLEDEATDPGSKDPRKR